MTNYNFVDNFIALTDTDTNKNFTSGTYTFVSNSVNVAAMTYIVRQYTVPLSQTTRSYQLMVNMSDLDNRYFPVDNYDRIESTGSGQRGRAVVVSASGGVATVSVYFYFTDMSGSTTFPTFNLNIIRRDFVDEF